MMRLKILIYYKLDTNTGNLMKSNIFLCLIFFILVSCSGDKYKGKFCKIIDKKEGKVEEITFSEGSSGKIKSVRIMHSKSSILEKMKINPVVQELPESAAEIIVKDQGFSKEGCAEFDEVKREIKKSAKLEVEEKEKKVEEEKLAKENERLEDEQRKKEEQEKKQEEKEKLAKMEKDSKEQAVLIALEPIRLDCEERENRLHNEASRYSCSPGRMGDTSCKINQKIQFLILELRQKCQKIIHDKRMQIDPVYAEDFRKKEAERFAKERARELEAEEKARLKKEHTEKVTAQAEKEAEGKTCESAIVESFDEVIKEDHYTPEGYSDVQKLEDVLTRIDIFARLCVSKKITDLTKRKDRLKKIRSNLFSSLKRAFVVGARLKSISLYKESLEKDAYALSDFLPSMEVMSNSGGVAGALEDIARDFESIKFNKLKKKIINNLKSKVEKRNIELGKFIIKNKFIEKHNVRSKEEFTSTRAALVKHCQDTTARMTNIEEITPFLFLDCLDGFLNNDMLSYRNSKVLSKFHRPTFAIAFNEPPTKPHWNLEEHYIHCTLHKKKKRSSASTYDGFPIDLKYVRAGYYRDNYSKRIFCKRRKLKKEKNILASCKVRRSMNRKYKTYEKGCKKYQGSTEFQESFLRAKYCYSEMLLKHTVQLANMMRNGIKYFTPSEDKRWFKVAEDYQNRILSEAKDLGLSKAKISDCSSLLSDGYSMVVDRQYSAVPKEWRKFKPSDFTNHFDDEVDEGIFRPFGALYNKVFEPQWNPLNKSCIAFVALNRLNSNDVCD